MKQYFKNGILKFQEGGKGPEFSWWELLPVVGSVQSGRRFFADPSNETGFDFGLNILSDLASAATVGFGGSAVKAVASAVKGQKALKAAKIPMHKRIFKAAQTINKRANNHPDVVGSIRIPTLAEEIAAGTIEDATLGGLSIIPAVGSKALILHNDSIKQNK